MQQLQLSVNTINQKYKKPGKAEQSAEGVSQTIGGVEAESGRFQKRERRKRKYIIYK